MTALIRRMRTAELLMVIVAGVFALSIAASVVSTVVPIQHRSTSAFLLFAPLIAAFVCAPLSIAAFVLAVRQEISATLVISIMASVAFTLLAGATLLFVFIL